MTPGVVQNVNMALKKTGHAPTPIFGKNLCDNNPQIHSMETPANLYYVEILRYHFNFVKTCHGNAAYVESTSQQFTSVCRVLSAVCLQFWLSL